MQITPCLVMKPFQMFGGGTENRRLHSSLLTGGYGFSCHWTNPKTTLAAEARRRRGGRRDALAGALLQAAREQLPAA